MSFIKGHIPWNKGKHLTVEHREKISKAHKGLTVWNKGKKIGLIPWNKGKKTGLIPWNKGKKNIFSEESRRKMGLANIGRHIIPWSKGKKGIFTEEARKKISLARKSRKGEKSPNWKGGISCRLNTKVWDEIRKQIYKRDNHRCRFCNLLNTKIHVHHIVPYKHSKDDREPNLITLCEVCHRKEHKEGLWDIIGYHRIYGYILKTFNNQYLFSLGKLKGGDIRNA